MNQKPSEIGWMYHTAPKSRSDEDPEAYPPPSQIPGLNGEEILYEPDDHVRGWIKDTDSKYIRLAKQGGRPDLLRINENLPSSKEAQGYPRCDWFYIEDNKMEDAQTSGQVQDSGKYVPRMPEYMVHEAYEAPGQSRESEHEGRYRPNRLPYATDRISAYERDGQSATDKTLKIAEPRKPGFGVRNQNNSGKVKRTPQPERAKNATRGEAREERMPEDASQPDMGKLIAGTYEREWHNRCDQWQKGQGKSKGNKKADQPLTAYQEAFAPQPPKREVRHGRRAGQSADQKHREGSDNQDVNREIRKMEKELDQQDLFKLSKFKNVPARIDTHRHNVPSQVF